MKKYLRIKHIKLDRNITISFVYQKALIPAFCPHNILFESTALEHKKVYSKTSFKRSF